MIEGKELERELTQFSYEILNHLDEERKPGAPWNHEKSNWASEIGNPCTRQLTLARTHWRESRPLDLTAMYRVQEGKRYEAILDVMLKGVGYNIDMQQAYFQWKKYQISGKTDGQLWVKTGFEKRDRQCVPLEIFSTQSYFFDSLTSIEKMKNHPKWWIRRKANQLNVYLLMQSRPGGFMIVCAFGKRPRILPMLLDYEMGEKDLQKVETVNRHIAEKTLPARIEYDKEICGMCGMFNVCKPLPMGKTNVIPEEWANYLNRLCDLRPLYDEYKELEKQLKGDKDSPGPMRGMNAIVGDVTISSTKYKTTRMVNVPPEIKERYGKTSEVTRTNIFRDSGEAITDEGINPDNVEG